MDLMNMNYDSRIELLDNAINNIVDEINNAHPIITGDKVADIFNIEEKISERISSEEDEDGLVKEALEYYVLDSLFLNGFDSIVEENGLEPEEFASGEIDCEFMSSDLINYTYTVSEMISLGFLILEIRRIIKETNSILETITDRNIIQELYNKYVENEDTLEYPSLGTDLYSILVFIINQKLI